MSLTPRWLSSLSNLGGTDVAACRFIHSSCGICPRTDDQYLGKLVGRWQKDGIVEAIDVDVIVAPRVAMALLRFILSEARPRVKCTPLDPNRLVWTGSNRRSAGIADRFPPCIDLDGLCG